MECARNVEKISIQTFNLLGNGIVLIVPCIYGVMGMMLMIVLKNMLLKMELVLRILLNIIGFKIFCLVRKIEVYIFIKIFI